MNGSVRPLCESGVHDAEKKKARRSAHAKITPSA
jgi:hypothetical protein